MHSPLIVFMVIMVIIPIIIGPHLCYRIWGDLPVLLCLCNLTCFHALVILWVDFVMPLPLTFSLLSNDYGSKGPFAFCIGTFDQGHDPDSCTTYSSVDWTIAQWAYVNTSSQDNLDTDPNFHHLIRMDTFLNSRWNTNEEVYGSLVNDVHNCTQTIHVSCWCEGRS